ncbi:MAG: chromosomal replication initiator protein DnaA [Pseudomonadota bacterium]
MSKNNDRTGVSSGTPSEKETLPRHAQDNAPDHEGPRRTICSSATVSTPNTLPPKQATPISSGAPCADGSDGPREAFQSALIGRMRGTFGDKTYTSWLSDLRVFSLKGTSVELSVTTRFMADWIRGHYLDRIAALCETIAGDPVDVTLTVAPAPALTGPLPSPECENDSATRFGSAAAAPRQSDGVHMMGSVAADALDRPSTQGTAAATPRQHQFESRFTFERFVVGRSNHFAYAAAKRVAESDEPHFNPLFLHGGVGLGKTHLMNAIGNAIHARAPERKVLYVSTESFMTELLSAMRLKNQHTFKERYRNVDVLMIDDAHFLAQKNTLQEEFFHTFNALIDARKQLVISADRSPAEMDDVQGRIRSRLNWGLVADIHATDFELRLGILQGLNEERSRTRVPEDVLIFLARNIVASVRDLEGAFIRIAANMDLFGDVIDVEKTRTLLQDMLRAHDRRVTIDEILRKVSAHYGLRLSDLLSPRRARSVSQPRQVAMYLAKRLTTRSLPEIGRKFGNRDHTTIMHGIKKITERLETDSALEQDIRTLKRELEG